MNDYFTHLEFREYVGPEESPRYSTANIDSGQAQAIETLEFWAGSAWPNVGVVMGSGNMTAASAILTIPSGPFLETDVGKQVRVAGAGVAGAVLATTISVYTSATQVTLDTAASTAVSGASVTWGDGDGTAASVRGTTEIFDGSTIPIMLSRVPLIAVSSLSIDGTVQDIDTYDVYSAEGYVRFENRPEYDPRSISVTYTYGFTSTPWAIKRPMMSAVKMLLDYQSGNSKIPMPGLTYYQTERATFSWARRRLTDRPQEPWPWDVGASEAIRTYWEPQRPINFVIV